MQVPVVDPAQVLPRLRTRRRAWLLSLPSSLVLLIALFLPSAQSCTGEMVHDHQHVVTAVPYLLGAVVLLGVLIPVRLTAATRAAAMRFQLATAILSGLALVWFALLTLDDGLVGRPLAAVASAWMLAGAAARRLELLAASPLPVAAIGPPRRSYTTLALAMMVVSFAFVAVHAPWAPRRPLTPPPPSSGGGLCLGMCGC